MNNQLNGSIPSSLGNITWELLSLCENQLTGSIPAALCDHESTINPQQGGVDLSGCGADSADRAVLVELYNSTEGSNWTNNTDWDSSEPLGQWHGVTTDESGRVTRLSLQDNQLDRVRSRPRLAASRIWGGWISPATSWTGRFRIHWAASRIWKC